MPVGSQSELGVPGEDPASFPLTQELQIRLPVQSGGQDHASYFNRKG